MHSKPDISLTAYIKSLENKKDYCERNHAFCPDCRDKLKPEVCLRCELQSANTDWERVVQLQKERLDEATRNLLKSAVCIGQLESLKAAHYDAECLTCRELGEDCAHKKLLAEASKPRVLDSAVKAILKLANAAIRREEAIIPYTHDYNSSSNRTAFEAADTALDEAIHECAPFKGLIERLLTRGEK